jgi:hypothetical protein
VRPSNSFPGNDKHISNPALGRDDAWRARALQLGWRPSAPGALMLFSSYDHTPQGGVALDDEDACSAIAARA